MYHISSSDGTQIALQRSGNGPNLLLVHGELVDRFYWDRMLPYLTPFFSVYSMDRRGHGDSGPYQPGHTLQREYEDLDCVIDSIGAPLDLLGNSIAARLCLHTANENPAVRRLTLIEPKESLLAASSQLHAQMRDCEATRDRECIVLNVLRELFQADSGADTWTDDKLRRTPLFDSAMRNAFSIPVELESFDHAPEETAQDAPLTHLILITVGSLSRPSSRQAAERMAASLSGSRLSVLEGLDCDAIVTSPAVLAEEIKAFLL
jgi:pimeloyl-ACP methyl ester carboxylesterase